MSRMALFYCETDVEIHQSYIQEVHVHQTAFPLVRSGILETWIWIIIKKKLFCVWSSSSRVQLSMFFLSGFYCLVMKHPTTTSVRFDMFFSVFCASISGNWWFGARWFGFLGMDCYSKVPLEYQTNIPNHPFTIS